MKLAFLGTGLMGTGFVRGLLARGHEVSVWNRSRDKTRPLAHAGARDAATPDDAARGAERVYVSLSDDDAVDGVLAQLQSPPPGVGPIIDFTTTAPIPTRKRAAKLAAEGRAYLHAPVFMGPENARLAQGLMLAAGPRELFDSLRPELEKMTGKLWYVGEEPGRAAAFKLFGNAMFFAVVAGLADVFTFARGAGITPPEVMELFAHLEPGRQLSFRGPRMAQGDFAASFELAMARKDVRLAIETALATPDPRLAILPSIAARMDDLIARGHGRDDLGVLATDAVREAPPRRRAFASTPVLKVSNLQRAVDFYTRVLGYQDAQIFGETFAMMRRDGHDLMLASEDAGWDMHLRVSDLGAEIRAIEAAGHKVDVPPHETEYGMREIEVLDPDGHRICLGVDLVRRPEDAGR